MGAPRSVGEVFNLGSDQEISIHELARRVIAQTGSSSAIRHIPYAQAYGQNFDDLPRRVPRLDKLRKVIDFSVRRNLEQIIADVAGELADKTPTRP
jgi:UDP-glucose 4-epimerase